MTNYYCDNCCNPVMYNDDIFTPTGGVLCRKCRNLDRAERARLALEAHKEALGEHGPGDKRDDVIDLVTDLLHYCHLNKVSCAKVLMIAKHHFQEEAGEEAGK